MEETKNQADVEEWELTPGAPAGPKVDESETAFLTDPALIAKLDLILTQQAEILSRLPPPPMAPAPSVASSPSAPSAPSVPSAPLVPAMSPMTIIALTQKLAVERLEKLLAAVDRLTTQVGQVIAGQHFGVGNNSIVEQKLDCLLENRRYQKPSSALTTFLAGIPHPLKSFKKPPTKQSESSSESDDDEDSASTPPPLEPLPADIVAALRNGPSLVVTSNKV